MEPITITIETTVNAPIEKAWKYWSEPAHITQWNNASPDWHTPRAENDLRTGGQFLSRMEAKDGSVGFDFAGTYTEVVPHQTIAYVLGDDRKVRVQFEALNNQTRIVESFEAETQNSIELQQGGWQAILNNFKEYTENN